MTDPALPQLGERLDPRLRQDLAAVIETVPLDDGGGATAVKVFLLAELIVARELSRIVEIGVYRGRLFLPIARLMYWLKRGDVVGIDPYSAQEAVQHDAELTGLDLESWPETVDWEDMYQEVRAAMMRLELDDQARIIRARSEDVADEFAGTPIDLLHVDGNHDRDAVRRDLDLYMPHMRDGSILVMDDVGWPSVRSTYEEIAAEHEVLFRLTEGAVMLWPSGGGNDFAILEVRRDPSGRT